MRTQIPKQVHSLEAGAAVGRSSVVQTGRRPVAG